MFEDNETWFNGAANSLSRSFNQSEWKDEWLWLALFIAAMSFVIWQAPKFYNWLRGGASSADSQKRIRRIVNHLIGGNITFEDKALLKQFARHYSDSKAQGALLGPNPDTLYDFAAELLKHLPDASYSRMSDKWVFRPMASHQPRVVQPKSGPRPEVTHSAA